MDWIAVGLKKDVPPGVVVPSCIGDVDLAIWCTHGGAYHAWSDRCPHRGMRLSHGFVRGNVLACIYHGWQYDQGGSCEYIPAHPSLNPPETICVPTFACEETGGVIWASLTAPQGEPPNMAGRAPVRSLSVHQSANDIAAHFGQSGQTVITGVSDYDVALALQPNGTDKCAVHALAPPEHAPKDVSRWLEEMRAELERGAP